MTSELKEILEQHQLWLNGKGGKCANLKDADLNYANLQGADLTGANLTGASLRGANLLDANLTGAKLNGASLRGANLTGANLNYANLSYAILPDISWIIPGCLVQLNKLKNKIWLSKYYFNFIQDSFGVIIQNNDEKETFDMLVEDRIIRNIPYWVKYTGLKQIPKNNEG